MSRTTYSFRGDRLLLEPKDQVKARLGHSPDDADAFALTFAQPVAARQRYYDRTMEGLARRRRARPGRALTAGGKSPIRQGAWRGPLPSSQSVQ